MEQLFSHCTDCHEIWYLRVFRNFLRNSNFVINRRRINSTLYYDQYTFLSHYCHIFLEREMLQTKTLRKIKTHILYPVSSPPPPWKSCRLKENVEEYLQRCSPQMTIRRTRIACRIRKATNTRSGCVTLIDFPLQQWLHERALVLRHSTLSALSCNKYLKKDLLQTMSVQDVRG